MDLILINPYPEAAKGINEGTIEPPLGLTYLAAIARERGHSIDLIDANALKIKAVDLCDHIMSVNPALVGISTNIVTHPAGIELVAILRTAGFGGLVILGGPLPSALAEYCLNSTEADAVVMGEGEETLIEILANVNAGSREPFRNVLGCLWQSRDAGNVREQPRPLIEDLNSLPTPAWDLLPPFSYYKSRARRRPIGALICSRGCPYQCTYCNKSVFGSRYRFYTVERALKEVRMLVDGFKIRQLDILDDNLTLNLDWAKEFFRGMVPFGLAINLQNGIRADLCDEELLDLMKAAGVFKISLGVESGSPEIQLRIKKKLILERVLQTTGWARKRGIVVYGNFILGLPYDSAETMLQTINFAIKMDPDAATFNYLLPLPGSEVWTEIERHGKFLFQLDDPAPTGFYGSGISYWLPGMNIEEVTTYYRLAYRRFYLRPKKIIGLMLRSLHPGEFIWLIQTILGVLGLPIPTGPRYWLPASRRIKLKSAPPVDKRIS